LPTGCDRQEIEDATGSPYYTYTKGNAQFFVLDRTYMSPQQLSWLERELQHSKADWKICYFHHPPYSSGGFHGSAQPEEGNRVADRSNR